MTLCCATCVGKATNCIYPNKVVGDNAADMESAVAVDHVCATYTGNHRGNSNFIESDVIPMDIDNDHSDNPSEWITEDKMEELFGDVDYMLVPSRHHMLAKDGKSEHPRYHAYFSIEKCTDATQYTAMKTAIQNTPLNINHRNPSAKSSPSSPSYPSQITPIVLITITNFIYPCRFLVILYMVLHLLLKYCKILPICFLVRPKTTI